MTTIYLIRHGAYVNPDWIFHGRLPGFPLSAKGKQQAVEMARYLKKKPVTAVYTSRLERARMTAEIIAKQFRVPVWTDERLLDIRSPLEGMPLGYLRRPKFSFYDEPYIVLGGETMRQIFDRVHHFLCHKAKDHPSEHIVVVTHGDMIMTVIHKYKGIKFPKFFPYDTSYVKEGKGYQIEFNSVKATRVIPIP